MTKLNIKSVPIDKCLVPRDKLRDCVVWLRYGCLAEPSPKLRIWHSKLAICRLLRISTTEVNRILKEEIPAHYIKSLLPTDKKARLNSEMLHSITSRESLNSQRNLTIAERCKAFRDRYPTVNITPYCLRKIYHTNGIK